MSETYSTGELAKLAGVSVRTVQYYDQRGLLVPSELTEGGRRIYSASDLQELRIICFLREMDFSIEQIKKLLAEENAGAVLDMLLQNHVSSLKAEIVQQKVKLDTTVNLLDSLKAYQNYSLANLADFSMTMKNQNSWRRLQIKMWASIIFAVCAYALAIWLSTYLETVWLAYVAMALFLPGFSWLVVYFRKQFIYLCPNCHNTFEPSFKEFALAGHTPRTRKLTCPHCQVKSYCLELAKEKH
ncbi:MerR family transcriptional regulator [Streptococcus plurextorum]|uniref:MerR family transcriptional regulator n=1 Tax=Streptococcus plurextorum TaxID=456876 RepID=UPI0004081536|nr:MerR family transcriptional regulator [Streptococcus plurextorum]